MAFWTRPQPQRRARIARPVTASAVTVSRANADGLRKLSQSWQERALRMYDLVPECWYPAQGYARSLKRIRFFPAILDDRGDPQEVEDGPLVDLFQRIQDPGGGGFSTLAGAYGQLQFLTGDGYLTVTQDPDGEEAWEYLSTVELRAKPGTDPQEFRRIRAPGYTPEELIDAPDDDFEPLGNQARVWRLWNRHPTYSNWGDSPVNAVLDLYDLLRTLTLAADATGTSRAANRGILFVADELDFGSGDTTEPDDDLQSEPFMQMVTAALQAAMANPGTAAAASPIVVRGKGIHELGVGHVLGKDLISWMAMGPEEKYAEADIWPKVIDRIANGLDLPVAMVTGDPGSANHWGAWLVDEQGFRLHVAPVADRFARDLNGAYLRPAAIAEGIENADMVVIGYDPAAAVNHPDETTTFRDAYRDGVVGPGTYRDKIGATDDDAPTDDELDVIFALQGKTPPGEEPPPALGPQDGGKGGDVEEGPPVGNGAVNASALQAAHVLGALSVTVQRGRELAGNRLVTKSQGCSECRERIEGVPAASVAYAMGPDQVRLLLNGRGDETDLVTGASSGFAVTAAGYGLPADIAYALGALAEQHTARTLYEEHAPPLPAGVHAVVAKAVR